MMAAAAVQYAPTPAHETIFEPKKLHTLRSNHGNYVDSKSTGWMKPTPRDTPIEEMRRRYEEESYIWIKELIPREDVYDMREQYITPTHHHSLPCVL